MRRLRMMAWALPLGLRATAAHAGDGGWAIASPAAQIGRPVAAPAAAPADPSALLGRPFAVGAAPGAADPQLRPASFVPVVRGQAPDARPLPTGEPGATTQSGPRVIDPAPGGPAVGGPFVGGPVVGGPFGGVEPEGADGDCGGACGCHKSILSWLHFDGLFGCGCKSCGEGCGAGCGQCSFGDGCCDCWDGCSGCDYGCGCEERNRFYVSGEYLMWWTKGDTLPPLITLGSASDFAAGLPAGSIVLPGTQTIFGGADYNAGMRSGARLMAGLWFGDDHLLGVEAGGFFLESRSKSLLVSGTAGSPIIARPIYNTLTGAPTVEFVSEPPPPALSGTAAASVRSSFWGGEINLRSNVWSGCCWNVDVIGGYRFMGLDDGLVVGESLSQSALGFAFQSFDSFQTRNRFNGGQIGIDAELRKNRWSLDLDAKLAIGAMSETAILGGGTTSNALAAPLPGGLLTLGRTGSFHRDRFAWSPDLGVKVGYNFTDHLRGFVGYDFLYLSNVLRAGDQVDLRVDPRLTSGLAGPANPPYAFHGSDFWAQGVNFGLEFRY